MLISFFKLINPIAFIIDSWHTDYPKVYILVVMPFKYIALLWKVLFRIKIEVL
jgi:hypothetical protein